MTITTENINKLLSWGLILIPCLITRDENGKKNQPLFWRYEKWTHQWKWALTDSQLPADTLENIISGPEMGLAGIVPCNIAVVDCDDKEAFLHVKTELEQKNIKTFYEKSFSWNEENQKHHFYFRTDNPREYYSIIGEYGIKGNGEVLGKGHLVYLNQKGWVTLPAEVENLPMLPFQKQGGCPQKITLNNGNDFFFQEGGRNNTLFRIGVGLWKKGVSKQNLFTCLTNINTQCNPPLPEKEIVSITRSIVNYEGASSKCKEAQQMEFAVAEANTNAKILIRELV